MTAQKKQAERRGRWAETIALLHLLVRGYRPVARRLKTPVGEIDLVMRRGTVLAVVEVKARPSLDEAAEAIRPRQWQRLLRAAEWLMAGRPGLSALSIRFDAVLVSGLAVRHVPDAWRP